MQWGARQYPELWQGCDQPESITALVLQTDSGHGQTGSHCRERELPFPCPQPVQLVGLGKRRKECGGDQPHSYMGIEMGTGLSMELQYCPVPAA